MFRYLDEIFFGSMISWSWSRNRSLAMVMSFRIPRANKNHISMMTRHQAVLMKQSFCGSWGSTWSCWQFYQPLSPTKRGWPHQVVSGKTTNTATSPVTLSCNIAIRSGTKCFSTATQRHSWHRSLFWSCSWSGSWAAMQFGSIRSSLQCFWAYLDLWGPRLPGAAGRSEHLCTFGYYLLASSHTSHFM